MQAVVEAGPLGPDPQVADVRVVQDVGLGGEDLNRRAAGVEAFLDVLEVPPSDVHPAVTALDHQVDRRLAEPVVELPLDHQEQVVDPAPQVGVLPEGVRRGLPGDLGEGGQVALGRLADLGPLVVQHRCEPGHGLGAELAAGPLEGVQGLLVGPRLLLVAAGHGLLLLFLYSSIAARTAAFSFAGMPIPPTSLISPDIADAEGITARAFHCS